MRKGKIFSKIFGIGLVLVMIGSMFGGLVSTVGGADQVIAPGELSYNSERKLARTSDGVLHCVYSRLDGSYSQIYHSYSTDEGNTWTEEEITNGPYRHGSPSIAIDSKDYIHVAWEVRSGSGSGETCAIQYRVKTTAWQPIENVITSQSYPSIAIDSKDNVHLAVGGFWGGAYSCHYVRYLRRSSSGWSSPEIVGSNCWTTRPTIVIDQSDNIHIFYEYSPRYGPHYGLRYRQKTASGWQSEEIIQTDDLFWQPGSIAVGGNGNVYMVYYGVPSYAPNCIKLTKKTSSGWHTEDVYPEDGYYQANPTISIDNNGYLHVVWQGKHSGSPNYYQIRHMKYDGSWSAVENLTSASQDQKNPNLIWAWHPEVSGAKANIPKNGYAFIWNDGQEIRFYKSSDLEWDTGPDTTPPTVISTFPEDSATDVPVGTNVTATFSEAMDSSTINATSFTLDGVSGTVTYDPATYTATFTPDAKLDYNHTYTATLSTAITDLAGNPLSEPYTWSFTTQSAPVAKSVITSPLEITPAKDMYYVGDTLTAKFTIINRGSKSVTFDVLVVGGRDPTGEVVDFDKTYDVTLNPGDSYDYEGDLALPDKPGIYHFFCAYHTEEHLPGENEYNWSTNIEVEIDGEIVEDFNEARGYRERDIIVFEKIYISPAPPPALWEKISGPWEDRLTELSQIAVHPNNPEVVYAAVKHYHFDMRYTGRECYDGDEVYRTTNGGKKWTPVNEGLPGYSKYYWPVSRIAFAPSHPEIVYIATTDPSPYSSAVISGRGIYLSTGGGSWSPIGGPGGKSLFGYTYYPISSLVIDPGDPMRIYAGTIGGGIWRKEGVGEWENIWNEPVHKETLLDVNALAISPANPNTIYATAYNFAPSEAMGWSGILIPGCLIKSEDGGDNWRTLEKWPNGKVDDIAVDERDAELLYIVTGVTQSYRVMKSADGGKTWNDASGTGGPDPLPDVDPILRTIGIYGTTGKMGSISTHPDNSDVIYTAGEWGFNDVYFSPDSGENWFPFGLKDKCGQELVLHVLELVFASNADSRVLYVAAIDGLFKIDLSEGPIEIRLRSSGELRVYDSQGRATGLVGGEVKEEIPNSAYKENVIMILSPFDVYRYEVVGTDEGTYGLEVTSIEDGSITTFTATDIPTASGAVHQYAIDWDALSEGGAGVTIRKDSDGNGDFEETIITSQPNTPSNPSPSNDTTNASIESNLSWTGGDPDVGDTVTYNVYFGTNSTPPLKETIGPYSANQTSISYDPGRISYNTTYYWKVVAKDNHGIVREGPLWDFTTEWGAWDYDKDDTGYIEIGELLDAISDYISSEINISQLLEVIKLYISHTQKP